MRHGRPNVLLSAAGKRDLGRFLIANLIDPPRFQDSDKTTAFFETAAMPSELQWGIA